MAALTLTQKRWIVVELAMYGTPTAVAEAFAAKFGVATDKSQVHTYDAGKARNRERMSEELIELFDRTREEWDAEVATIAIANKRWRLEEMQRMYQALPATAAKRKLAILEQAAKDAGDAFTNKRDITTNGQSFKALVGIDLDAV